MNDPVAYINVEKRTLEWATLIKWKTPTTVKMDKVPLYTTPPQREWQGLTDEEIYALGFKTPVTFARAVEAKLKEKNAI